MFRDPVSTIKNLSRRVFLGAASSTFLVGCVSSPQVNSNTRTLKQVVKWSPTIDVHAHLVPPGWFGSTGRPVPNYTKAQLTAQIARNQYIPVPDAENRVERDYDRLMRFEAARFDGTIKSSIASLMWEMDTAGIDIAVNNCMDEFRQPFGRSYIVALEKVLEDIARMAAKYSGRLVNFFGVDPRRGRDGLTLLRRAVTDFGCRGMGEWLTNQWTVVPIDRDIAYPYFELCAELGIPYGDNGSSACSTQAPEVFAQVM